MTQTKWVKTLVWNIEDRILDETVRQRIRTIDADVVLLVEGYFAADNSKQVAEAISLLAGTTYDHWTFDYKSVDKRKDEHGYIVLIKRALTRGKGVEVTPIQGPARQFVHVKLPALHGSILLVHLDDRRIAKRLAEVTMLLEYLAVTDKEHAPSSTVVVGDFNSDHHDSTVGKLLNFWLIRHFINLLVALGLEVDPTHTYRQSASSGDATGLRRRVGKIVSLARRLRDMTASRNKVLDWFANHQLEDAMPQGVVTRPLIGRVGVQLDHVVRDTRVVAVKDVSVVLGSPSDHNAVVFEAKWK